MKTALLRLDEAMQLQIKYPPIKKGPRQSHRTL